MDKWNFSRRSDDGPAWPVDENGSEISRETRDSSGNLVGDSTEPTTQEQNEE